MHLYDSKVKSLCGDDEFAVDEIGQSIEKKVQNLMNDPDFIDEFYRTFDNEGVHDAVTLIVPLTHLTHTCIWNWQ